MEFNSCEKNENGYKIRTKSKFLDFILNMYSKRIVRKVRKVFGLSKNVEIDVQTEVDFKLNLNDKKEENNA